MKKILLLNNSFFQLKSLMVALMMAFVVASATSCESSDVDGDDSGVKSGTGVTVSGGSSVNIGSSGGEIVLSFNTSASYTLTVDDAQMLTVKSGATGSAGQNRATLQVSANTTQNERWGEVTISVSGYSDVATVNIIQAYKVEVDSRDEVLKWVDERLQKEYYWLDIYGSAVKNGKVDYTLSNDYQNKGYSNPYQEFLDRTLLSLSGNEEDGGLDSKGTRRIYSYITRASTASSSTRAGSASEGFGIIAQSIVQVKSNPNEFVIPVEHAYLNSPAYHAGLKRGDFISEYNGQKIGDSNYVEAWYAINGAVSDQLNIGYDTEEDGQETVKTINLTMGSFYKNPVACSKVLELSAEINPSGKKIGYLSYLQFDNQYDNELISAIRELASEGVEEFILDLRLNGGGVVNTSVMLSSMILSESHVGEVYAYLRRHPQNPYGDDTCYLVKENSSTQQDLPNLNLDRVWIITTNSTASASEMVIQGLRGLDIEVNLVGLKSEGKNCGMDVTRKSVGAFEYTYAPITFMNYNAKEFNDYADGIVPDTNFADWVSEPLRDENGDIVRDENGKAQYVSRLDDRLLQSLINNFPIAQSDWAHVVNDGKHPFDVAVYESVMQINGTTALVPKSESSEQEASTRAMAKRGYVSGLTKFEHNLKRPGGGSLYYGIEEREQAKAQQ